MEKTESYLFHRFLDEAGDTTFYGKGKTPIVGNEGVSKNFILGMLKINNPLHEVRTKVIQLQDKIANDTYFQGIPSIEKKKANHGYYLHAKDDVPEIRKMAFDLINSIDCSFECVVARKKYDLYEKNHHSKEGEFYLIKYERLVLNIAERKKCTSLTNLEFGLQKALERAKSKSPDKEHKCCVVFNIQQPTNEPLLNLTDYFCWAIQRVFEKGELRYYDYISNKISLVVDLYDFEKYKGSKNYYSEKNKLTKDNYIK